MEVDCIVFLLQKLQQGPVLSENYSNNLYSLYWASNQESVSHLKLQQESILLRIAARIRILLSLIDSGVL